jgi:hypothetical protein
MGAHERLQECKLGREDNRAQVLWPCFGLETYSSSGIADLTNAHQLRGISASVISAAVSGVEALLKPYTVTASKTNFEPVITYISARKIYTLCG